MLYTDDDSPQFLFSGNQVKDITYTQAGSKTFKLEGSTQIIAVGNDFDVAPTFVGTENFIAHNIVNHLYVAGDHDVLGALTIDQASTTGAVPVLTVDQADVDEDFFKFIGTSDTNVDRALVDAADFTTPGAIKGWLKINIQDDQGTAPIVDGDYYIPFYAAPTA